MRTQINCPQCGSPVQAEVHQIIDVGQNPELKSLLMNGQLNVAGCQNCGTAVQLSTPMLYHDPAHELFMFFMPPQMNTDTVQREQLIGRLTREVMDNTPPEQRKAYLFQPEQILTLQTFMEKVLETEGITKEMIQRQQKQAELLQTMLKADRDVVEHLLKERSGEVDETFFAMLDQYLNMAQQMQDEPQMVKMVNLRALLMTKTPFGQELERRQVALHALNREAKANEGLSPEILLKHILKHLGDDGIINSMIGMGQGAINYEFFQKLTEEIENAPDGATKEQLTELREALLQLQEEMRQQSMQMMANANEVINAIVSAPDKQAALAQNAQKIDDVFMYTLSARIAQADQEDNHALAQTLNQINDMIMSQVENQVPPEIRLLNGLLEAGSGEEQDQLLSQNQSMLSGELVDLLDMLAQRTGASDPDTVERINTLKGKIQAHLS